MKLRDGMRVAGRIHNTRIDRGAITIEDGRYYFCQDLKDGLVCRDKKGFRYSWDIFLRPNGTYPNEIDLYPLTNDIENVYEGAIIEDKSVKRKVLGICGEVVLVSVPDTYGVFSFGATIETLKKSRYKLVLDEPEIDKIEKVDKKLTNLTPIIDSIKHHEENLLALKDGKRKGWHFINYPSRCLFKLLKILDISYGNDACALCEAHPECIECPLRQYQGKKCSSNTVWNKLREATTIDEAIKGEGSMIEVLEKILKIKKKSKK